MVVGKSERSRAIGCASYEEALLSTWALTDDLPLCLSPCWHFLGSQSLQRADSSSKECGVGHPVMVFLSPVSPSNEEHNRKAHPAHRSSSDRRLRHSLASFVRIVRRSLVPYRSIVGTYLGFIRHFQVFC
jgi:hypothetical protein